jgi:predicted secreted protein
MAVATGIALYFVVWWIALFAVLPFWTRPVDATREEGGWRGAPESPNLGRKMLATTVVSALIWVLIWYLAKQDVLGIRQGP